MIMAVDNKTNRESKKCYLVGLMLIFHIGVKFSSEVAITTRYLYDYDYYTAIVLFYLNQEKV